jgi:hypothetical protein
MNKLNQKIGAIFRDILKIRGGKDAACCGILIMVHYNKFRWNYQYNLFTNLKTLCRNYNDCIEPYISRTQYIFIRLKLTNHSLAPSFASLDQFQYHYLPPHPIQYSTSPFAISNHYLSSDGDMLPYPPL